MKRIVICCDGTWNSPEDLHPTNVVHVARAVVPRDQTSDRAQIVFYDWGLGTGNFSDRVSGGAFGDGLDKNIQDAYRFLVHNYEPGDALYLFGFSRGAYTVRSLAGLIRNCGILQKTEAHRIPRAYTIYRGAAGPDSATALDFRTRFSRHGSSLPEILFLGVWDTVGALGIPLRFLAGLNARRYRFHDTELSRITRNAFHAVAIDEKRGDFVPVLWHNRPKPGQRVEQRWFCGVHCDVGGGYADAGLATVALQWMVRRATATGLVFDQQYLAGLTPNPEGRLHRSKRGIYRLKSWQYRTITPYHVTRPEACLDASVRQRYRRCPDYRPEPLRRFLAANGLDW